MNIKTSETTKFPKGFFTNIKACSTSHNKNCKEYDKPFEWSKNVLSGKSKVKLVSLKGTKN